MYFHYLTIISFCLALQRRWRRLNMTMSVIKRDIKQYIQSINQSINCIRPVGRNFQKGVRRGLSCYCDRSPVVFGAKSCNLAISRHFILTFGKSCFSKLIFKDFYEILDFISRSLNKPRVSIWFRWGGGRTLEQGMCIHLNLHVHHSRMLYAQFI